MRSSRFGKEITRFPAKIESTVVIGRLHAGPFNDERDADMSEKEIGRKGNKADPDEELWSQGREKELTDSLLHSSIIKLEFSIRQTLSV